MKPEDIIQLEEIINEADILNGIMLKTLKYYEYEEGRFTSLVYLSKIIDTHFKKKNLFLNYLINCLTC